jgi:hypothetical protein
MGLCGPVIARHTSPLIVPDCSVACLVTPTGLDLSGAVDFQLFFKNSLRYSRLIICNYPPPCQGWLSVIHPADESRGS